MTKCEECKEYEAIPNQSGLLEYCLRRQIFLDDKFLENEWECRYFKKNENDKIVNRR